jgi:saccharopine dehydrogenase (NADP+, L-glutamate forming)
MLGAGFVTRPTLDVLSDAGIEVSVGMKNVPSGINTLLTSA